MVLAFEERRECVWPNVRGVRSPESDDESDMAMSESSSTVLGNVNRLGRFAVWDNCAVSRE